MRYLRVLTLLLCCSAYGYSQDTLRHYLNEDFEITSKDSATYFREIISQDDHIQMSFYNMEGVEFNYCGLKSMNPFIMHGLAKHYYKAGVLYSQGKYNRGRLMGRWQYYTPNGDADTVIYQPIPYYANKMAYHGDKSLLKRPTIEQEYRVRESLTQFFSKEFHLPARTRSKATSVSFEAKAVVDSDGKLKGVEIPDTIDEDLQNEVYRLMYMYHCDFESKDAFETTFSYSYKEEPSSTVGIVKPAEFPGGEIALRKYIGLSVMYPILAQENGIKGRVYVSFTVAIDGKIKDVKIARGIHELLDAESLRVVNAMPVWTPASIDGIPVEVSYTIPITFSLQ